MGSPPQHSDASIAETTTKPSLPPREYVTVPREIIALWETRFVSARGSTQALNRFVVQLQAASRTYLSKLSVRFSMLAPRSPGASSSASYLTREARYARAEAALRAALSRCDTEPSPLELQVRVLDKGLQAWKARAGRGYERVQKAEEAWAAARLNEEDSLEARSSFSELQREKWMAMKERDEALAMVEKIKELIKELNTYIKEGLKSSLDSMSLDKAPQQTLDGADDTLSCDTASKKVAILFSGRFPMPYLENLPRSRRSVEPLRLPLQVTNQPSRERSSTLSSEPAGVAHSSPSATQQHFTPPATPTDDFGAVFIHQSPPLKSMAHYLSEMEESGYEGTRGPGRPHAHIRLPSYVGALLDELGEDRLGNEELNIQEILPPVTHRSSASSTATSTNSSQGLTFARPPPNKLLSKGLLGRPFRNLHSARSHLRSPSEDLLSKENHDPSIAAQETSVNSTTIPEKIPHTSFSTSTGTLPLSPPLTPPTMDASPSSSSRKRMENLMQSVKKGVKRVSRRGG
ncbi:hypothetical protein JB92DRAFT_3149762 [Gautieria morchelliformis]|nr:hypothetical protein JB92DRAFT_3149762 [Gautieria morchelliformis]